MFTRKSLTFAGFAAGFIAVAGSASATPVSYNGASFDFYVSGSGTSVTLYYEADFSGWLGSATQLNIGGIDWKISGNDVVSASLVGAPDALDRWTGGVVDTNLSNTGCTGGSNGSVCIERASGAPPYAIDPANGTLQWAFNVTFTSPVTEALFNADNTGNPIRMWFLDDTGRGAGLMSCVTGNTDGQCGGGSVPEPGTLALLGLGLLGIAGVRRRWA